MAVDYRKVGAGGTACEDRGRGQHAAGEDVALDEVGAAPVGAEAFVGDGDGLHRGAPARLQAVVQLREVAGPEALADRLEHLDRDDVVVPAAHMSR
jgi:hypothetical protein